MIKVLLIYITCLFIACSQSKKSTSSNNETALPLFYEIIPSSNELNKSEAKQFSITLTTELKKKGTQVITKEGAMKLLQDKIQDIFDYYKSKELSLEKYKDEAAKKMNQIPSVAKKISFKFYKNSETVDSVYIISDLFTNIFEKRRPDSIRFINNNNAFTFVQFITDVIDSCNKKNFF